ncbi:hypothetical protein CXG81DRAFT_23249 [Caulochytrium protostelioides]|uniref:Uncharacterized protein n=1 Tax=Caulochytrium protostelioides TaxID=1555241 RepID=A0A4P9XF00_9FUNG|nr:hypothetical protein CXG81DRAFT_23249 [Caulochytrium protostelioides]|eukprot:RKP04143.1 hypothetical protein CXG81DRAFT_23249 [Caulochytrium protostelioides]
MRRQALPPGASASRRGPPPPPGSSKHLSPDVQHLLKSMMRSSQLSHRQCATLEALVQQPELATRHAAGYRTAAALPPVAMAAASAAETQARLRLPPTMLRRQRWQMNPEEFEREQYVGTSRRVDRDETKRKLQTWMANSGVDGPSPEAVAAAERRAALDAKRAQEASESEFEVVLGEVRERRAWLSTMAPHGRTAATQRVEQEIEERMRHLEALDAAGLRHARPGDLS